MEIIYTATRKKPRSIKGKYFIISLKNSLNDFPLYVLTQPNQIIINIILQAISSHSLIDYLIKNGVL